MEESRGEGRHSTEVVTQSCKQRNGFPLPVFTRKEGLICHELVKNSKQMVLLKRN